jgi:hypothetical protein
MRDQATSEPIRERGIACGNKASVLLDHLGRPSGLSDPAADSSKNACNVRGA